MEGKYLKAVLEALPPAFDGRATDSTAVGCEGVAD